MASTGLMGRSYIIQDMLEEKNNGIGSDLSRWAELFEAQITTSSVGHVPDSLHPPENFQCSYSLLLILKPY